MDYKLLFDEAIDAMYALEETLNTLKPINVDIDNWAKSDFYEFRISAAHPKILEHYVKMLDVILGDDLASYYFYEASMMQNGGKIVLTNGKEYPIQTINDVIKYCSDRP